jgi:uncharacterized protein YeaO (DUF488 family)
VIQHASIYDIADIRDPASSEGLRVLVMRRWPRGVRRERPDVWLKDAGPSVELLHAYTHAGLAWDEFEQRYRAEMLEERADVLERLRELEREHGVLTLLCRERIAPGTRCHREVLAELLREPQLA